MDDRSKSPHHYGLALLAAAVAMSACSSSRDEGGANTSASPLTGAATAGPAGPSPAELAKMRAFVDERLDLSTVQLTLQDRTGRLVDCVDRDRQPALRRSERLGQKPKAPPTSVAPITRSAKPDGVQEVRLATLYDGAADVKASSVPESARRRCPPGTVPTPRITLDELTKYSTLDEYTNKEPPQYSYPHFGSMADHQHAVISKTQMNWGAFSVMNVWQPYVQTWPYPSGWGYPDEFSLTQMWLFGGSGSGLQSMEVGFQVSRYIYGDDYPHLFIYSTRANYTINSGCYNNSCGDFVQVSDTIYPGAIAEDWSVDGGYQFEAYPMWLKDGINGDWWLTYGYYWDSLVWVGYYQQALYSTPGLAEKASSISFGGEIINREKGNGGGYHTETDMGSGHFPQDGYFHAAYQRELQYTTDPGWGTWYDATGFSRVTTDSYCYDIIYDQTIDDGWGANILFGGVGFNVHACL